MALRKIKITQLPASTAYNGLFTIGVDGNNQSVKVSLSFFANIVDASGNVALPWNNITGKPLTYAPSAHNHTMSEITDLDIPSKTSDLTNDNGFITNAVNDLLNYYLKTETYSKGEVNNLIGNITKVTVERVNELPLNPLTNVIYFVPKSGTGDNDVYDEFMYINESWEKIGVTQLDLSGYATSEWVNQQISDFLTSAQITTLVSNALSDYYTKDEVDDDIDAEALARQEADAAIQANINEMMMGRSDYYVAGWNPEDLSPNAVAYFGRRDFLDTLNRVWLIDTTDNTMETTKAVGELKRNNYLRFVDDSFAPVVGITELERAECDVALYLDAEHTQQYCDAGEFNAVTFYNTYGMSQSLFNANGEEVRILRPWETTETKYSVMIGCPQTLHVLDGLGTSGKWWKGVFSERTQWDGVWTRELAPTAISPCPVTTIGGKTRTFFFDYAAGDANTTSGKGVNNIVNIFDNGRTYPRVSNVSQINNMTLARANNATDCNYPFAEGGFHAINRAILGLEAFYKTNYLHNAALFGSGISANDSCGNETQYMTNGGMRFKTSDGEWSYCGMGSTLNICTDNAGTKTNASNFLNQYKPKEQCMESQMALSFAIERSIAENQSYIFYGSSYKYKSINNTTSPANGRMNAVVYKIMSETVSAFDVSGNATNYDLEVNLRMSLFDGLNLSGDIYAYWGGGLEMVGTANPAESGSIGQHVDVYIETNQKNWVKENSVSQVNLGRYGFESIYEKTGEFVMSSSYTKSRIANTPCKSVNGGGLSTGQCYYFYGNNYWGTTLNSRVRVGCRVRGNARDGACSPRSVDANRSAADTRSNYGGSAQVLFRV